MAYKAHLTINNKEFDLITCEYELHRDLDPKLKPIKGIKGGTIKLAVESTGDNFIIESMLNQFKTVDGKVIFAKDGAKIKELSFQKGYIINFSEGLLTPTSTSMIINFVIVANKINIGTTEHVNDWPT